MRQTKIVVTRYGGPEVITVAEQECPTPITGEVRRISPSMQWCWAWSSWL